MFDGYIICGTPRSGSTLLCNLLAATKRAGNPDSFFYRPSLSWWASEWGLPSAATLHPTKYDAAYLEAALAEGRGDTGVFGLRLMMETLGELREMLGRIDPEPATDSARFQRAFGKVLYIHLTLEDKLAQAVSRVKAEQTGLWHVAPDGTEIERLAPPAEPRYDFLRIENVLKRLERDDAAWTAWFDRQGIVPLRVVYERFSADPASTLIRICGALGVPVPDRDEVSPGVARLADAVSLDWMRRYRSEVAATRETGVATHPDIRN